MFDVRFSLHRKRDLNQINQSKTRKPSGEQARVFDWLIW